jgi:hypothetical protein
MAEDRRHLVSNDVLERYKRLSSGKPETETTEEHSGRKPLQGDWYLSAYLRWFSPICFEDLEDSTLANTVFCIAQCRNNIHKECFNQWKKSKMDQHAKVTCGISLWNAINQVYCRADWVNDDVKPKVAQVRKFQRYMNLGSISGQSPVRGNAFEEQSNGKIRAHITIGVEAISTMKQTKRARDEWLTVWPLKPR